MASQTTDSHDPDFSDNRCHGGAFFLQQLDCCLDCGAEKLYIAMFDKIDEGTAIFKTARRVPTAAPGSTFVPP